MQNHNTRLAGLVSTIALLATPLTWAQPAPQAQSVAPVINNRLEMASTVGELMRMDAAAALEAEKNKLKPKTASGLEVGQTASGASVTSAAKPIKRHNELASQTNSKPIAPVLWLSEVSGITGQRQLRFNQQDGPSLSFIEGSKTSDAADPQWQLNAIRGRCATFSRFEHTKTAGNSSKTVKSPSASQKGRASPSASPSSQTQPNLPLSKPYEVCYRQNLPISSASAVALAETVGINAGSAKPPLPSYVRP